MQLLYTGSVTQIPSRDNIIKYITTLCECAWHVVQALENLKWGFDVPDAGAKNSLIFGKQDGNW